jgi:hypothetical protein
MKSKKYIIDKLIDQQNFLANRKNRFKKENAK